MRVALILLIVLSLGLGAAYFLRHKKAVAAEQVRVETIMTISNQLEEAKAALEKKEQVAMTLETNLAVTSLMLASKSNDFVKISADLAKVQKEAQAAAEAAKAEMAKRDSRINELETQRDDLTKKIDDLNLSIATLDNQIAQTEKKLSASEGDREFLLKELKRLQTEKAELERQFNDLSVLRTQVSKLKEELSVSRRLEWIRMGIYGSQDKKGAERLMQPKTPASAKTNFNLNVELKQDGSSKVVPAHPPK